MVEIDSETVAQVVSLQEVALNFSMRPTGTEFVNNSAFEFLDEHRSFDKICKQGITKWYIL